MTLGQMKREWKADTGADRYRRGLYTFFWRATPFPFLTTFDAPGGEQTCTRRLRSNTPLQALTLLNDPALVEIARRLPGRIYRERPDGRIAEPRSSTPSSLCLGREPTDSELAALDAAARGKRTGGRRPRPAGELRLPIRGWMAVARVLCSTSMNSSPASDQGGSPPWHRDEQPADRP